jgi:hypothetical protein
MQLTILKRGDKGPLVGLWQEFLHGEGLYKGRIDCDYGPKTHNATKEYEAIQRLPQDGIVDDALWGAAMAQDLAIAGSRWVTPDKPDFKPLSVAQKHKRFGRIESKAAPTRNNPEAIRITNNWQREYLSRVHIPQLVGIVGAPYSRNIFVNKLAVEPMKALFQYWEDNDLMHYVKSWAGSWVPRYVRRAPGVLSSHAWGTAFDINAECNGLGRHPAPSDDHGTVIPLVQSANDFGFWWGGHWNRPDGMHFELVMRKRQRNDT